MALQRIDVYLGKFRTFGNKDAELKTALQAIILKQLKANILTSQISIRQGRLFLTVHPTLKSELFLKKTKIEKELQVVLGRFAEVR